MKKYLAMMTLVAVTTYSASLAQEAPPPGTHAMSLSRSEVDKTLSELAPHAAQFPVQFASDQQRVDLQSKLMHLLTLLDAAVLQYPNETDLLLRDAVANSFGHNMGCPGCAQKAVDAYNHLLQLQPEDRMVNWRYGAFLAQTAEREKSLPYLQKAASLGLEYAHYTAAMVYISLDDQDHAKVELRQYVKANPKDKEAKGLLKDIEHGDLHIRIHDGPPPQADIPAAK